MSDNTTFYLICCNDTVHYVVAGNIDRANEKLAEFTADGFSRHSRTFGMCLDRYMSIYFWHIDECVGEFSVAAAEIVAATQDDDERAYQQSLAEQLSKEDPAENESRIQRPRRERGGLGIE